MNDLVLFFVNGRRLYGSNKDSRTRENLWARPSVLMTSPATSSQRRLPSPFMQREGPPAEERTATITGTGDLRADD